MTFGLCCYSPARHLHPASLLVRVPATKRSLPILSTCALRPRPNLQLRLASPPPSGSFHPDSSPHLPSTRAPVSDRLTASLRWETVGSLSDGPVAGKRKADWKPALLPICNSGAAGCARSGGRAFAHRPRPRPQAEETGEAYVGRSSFRRLTIALGDRDCGPSACRLPPSRSLAGFERSAIRQTAPEFFWEVRLGTRLD